MKKVLFLITHSDIGGAGKHVLLAAQKAKKEGLEVLVGSGSIGWLSEELKKKGIQVFFFKNLKRSLNPLWALFFVFELKKFLKKENIDAINFNSSNTLFGLLGLICLKDKPRTIFTVHGLSYLSPGFKKSKIIKVIYKLAMKTFLSLIDEVIFVCNYDKNLAEEMELVKKGQGRVVYNETEKIDFLGREEAIKELRKIREFPTDKIIIGTITRLEYAKNNEMLIDVFAKLDTDRAICVIIGSGPEEQKIKSQISNLNLENKIFLLGDIPDAAKYLKVFDIFAITSRYEGLPYALLEAMSAKLKIIATRVGGIPEVLKGKGILIEPDNTDQLVSSLNQLIRQSISPRSGEQP